LYCLSTYDLLRRSRKAFFYGDQRLANLVILRCPKIYTSRLHCYLPCRSMGIDVDFKPKRESDQRYSGLHPLSEAQFTTIRSALRQKLNDAIVFIAQHQPDKKRFYEFWRVLWSDKIMHADHVYNSNKTLPIIASHIDIDEAVSRLKSARITSASFRGASSSNREIQLAFGFDQNLKDQYIATLNSILSNTSSGVECHILGRGLCKDYIDLLGRRFPEVPMHFYPMESIDYGKKIRTLKHITKSTMDRVFLPELLEIQKVIYLDTDLIVLSDISQLWSLSLDEYFYAGIRSRYEPWSDIMSLVFRASLRLNARDGETLRAHALSVYPDSAGKNYNAGVLVLNLQIMRDALFTRKAIDLFSGYSLNDQDVLALISNGNVLELDWGYNHVPSQSFNANPSIVHWAGPRKPWMSGLEIPFKHEYNKGTSKIEGFASLRSA